MMYYNFVITKSDVSKIHKLIYFKRKAHFDKVQLKLIYFKIYNFNPFYLKLKLYLNSKITV